MGDKYNQNIFELLSEDGAKKQKKQEVAAPAKQEKAKPKAATPAAAAPKKNQGSQGRGRGRGRGPRQGRGQQQTPLGVDDRNAQGAGNNRGKQMSRRQRDEAFKRGDYGAPDAEGRQKRAYDKFSHSSGARRKQEKKGGHGAGNWGEKGKDEEVAEEEKKEGEEIVENVEGEEVEGEEVEKEESDNEIDYEEFVERQKKESEELSKLVEVQEARKIDAAEFEGMKPLSKGAKDEQLFAITGGKNKKGKKGAAGPKDGKISADKVLNFQAPRQDNRRGGKGRQNNRQQRGGNKRSANVNLNDDKDFPSL